MKYLLSIVMSILLLSFWSCSDDGSIPAILGNGTEDCSEELDCANVCGGTAEEDVCGVCEGTGYNSNGCCGDDLNCVSYSVDIEPTLATGTGSNESMCIGCHGASALGGLNLLSYSNLMNASVVIAFESANSTLIQKLSTVPLPQRMPQNDPNYFNDDDGQIFVALIAKWIDQGALDN